MLLILQPVAGLKLFYADVDSPPVNYTPEVLGSQSIQLSDSVYKILKVHVIVFENGNVSFIVPRACSSIHIMTVVSKYILQQT